MKINAALLNEESSQIILDSIIKKRTRLPSSPATIEAIIKAFVAGDVPDYQMSAWLATVATIGMTMDEIEALTRAYVAGGTTLTHPPMGRRIVDKHSTGGVGDKVTFIVVPVVAACGVPVTKISGRGLGHAGGTLDKLESISGLKLDLNAEEMGHIIKEVGMVMTGQSGNLVPGDKATYQLRDISGAVESIPLIAASIISKKVATGADCLVLDVKTGSGALIQDNEGANELAEVMVELASRFGISCRAVISDMSQPLGYAVGNALEIKEALDVLQGKTIPGLTEVCHVLAKLMLQAENPELSDGEAEEKILTSISSGAAYERFVKWARVQGADEQTLLKPELLPRAQNVLPIMATQSGWVSAVDPRMIGNASYRLGANRQVKGSVVDHSAGIVLHKRVGDKVGAGEPLAEMHYNDADIKTVEEMIRSGFTVTEDCPTLPPIIHRII